MKVSRHILRLAFACLVLLSALLTPKVAQADINCYEVGSCTICDMWTGTTYTGYLKKCSN